MRQSVSLYFRTTVITLRNVEIIPASYSSLFNFYYKTEKAVLSSFDQNLSLYSNGSKMLPLSPILSPFENRTKPI